MTKEIIESYTITEGGFNVKVNITGGQGKIKEYSLVNPEIPVATVALLDQVKQELIGEVRLSAEEILDVKTIEEVKTRFFTKAKELLNSKLPSLDPNLNHFLVMTLMKEMLGLGDVEILLNDSYLEEIVITSSSEPVRVYHKKYGWLNTNLFPKNEFETKNYISTIARRVGRQITTLYPLLDAHLLSGDRSNAVLYPIASKGNTVTIRKFARDPWTMVDFIKNNTCSAELFALIWFAMQYESNVLISGGTGSGKTSLLNVCMPFIPQNHRIIIIEDPRELMLPEFLYWCPLTTRQPNPEGKGEVTMLDLLINSLRMRPDRIVLGEMRKRDQAEVLFEAMHTGHSVYATVHADSILATIQRLVNPPIEVPPNLLTAVNLVVVMFRDRRQNIRRIYQVGEFLPEEGKNGVKPNITHRWNPSTDKIITHQKPVRLFEELSRHTGLTQHEIDQDIDRKASILNWMVKNDFRDIGSVGKIIRAYYLDSESLLTSIKTNKNPADVLKGEA